MLNPDPNSQGGKSPSIHFIPRQGTPVVHFDEWAAHLRDLNFVLNSMLNYALNQIYQNPNMPTQQQIATLNQIPILQNYINSLIVSSISGTGTNTHIARWNGTGVPNLEDSRVIVDNSGNVTPQFGGQTMGANASPWGTVFTGLVNAPSSNLSLQTTNTNSSIILIPNGTGAVAGSTSSSGNLKIDSTTDSTKGYLILQPTGGNVGIGTSTPSTLLDVKDANIEFVCGPWGGDATYCALGMAGDISTSNYNFISSKSVPNLYFNRPSGSHIIFREGNGGTNQFIMASGGSIGINKNTPSALIDIVDAATTIEILIGVLNFGANYATIGLANDITANNYNFTSSTSDTNLYINTPSSKSIKLRSNNSDIIVLSTGSAVVTGDVKLGTAGNGLYVKEGSNATMGIATLSAGSVVVSTTKVTANSRIFLTIDGGTLTNVGATYVSARTAGTSFTISSTNVLDSSNVSWLIVEPA